MCVKFACGSSLRSLEKIINDFAVSDRFMEFVLTISRPLSVANHSVPFLEHIIKGINIAKLIKNQAENNYFSSLNIQPVYRRFSKNKQKHNYASFL